ncbi:MAG TPA: response regulator [Chitinophagaceae bacterium]|nr:response regulator [Chitinophagaceae bacterium]
MKKILLIEDNADIRLNTAEILELSNYKVLTAANGKQGVEMALTQHPDLIICDIMMPELDGYGVLHAVQKHEELHHTPFIFLTARAERTDFRKGMELGADDYLTKPFDATELLNAVDGRLKKSEQLKRFEAANASFAPVHSDKDVMEAFTDGRNINRYKKKQQIYAEGNHPNRVYYVISGKVKVYKGNEDGKELVTDLYSRGDFFGYIALLEESPYRDIAEALEDSEVAVIPREEFTTLIHNNPMVAQRFIHMLAGNITDKENQLLALAYNSLRKKVADALLKMQNKYQTVKDEKFVIDISRDSLAAIAGTATESLIRTLSDFKNEKLIEITGSAIKILNRQKLENLIN